MKIVSIIRLSVLLALLLSATGLQADEEQDTDPTKTIAPNEAPLGEKMIEDVFFDKSYLMEYGIGPAFNSGGNNVPYSHTLGNEAVFSIGKWVKSGLGVRLSYSLAQTTYDKVFRSGEQLDRTIDNTTFYHDVNSGIYAEALFKPEALKKNEDYYIFFKYNPHRRFDYFLTGGLGFGWRSRYGGEKNIHSCCMGLRLGAHGLYKLSDDVQFFLEPSYSFYFFGNSKASKGTLGLRLGITKRIPEGELLHPAHLDWNWQYDIDNVVNGDVLRWAYGIGVGFAFGVNKYTYDEGYDNGVWSAEMYGKYSIDARHGVRMNVSLTQYDHYTIKRSAEIYNYFQEKSADGLSDELSDSYDYNTRNLSGLTFTLAYNLNISNAFTGFIPNRICKLDFFAGPAFNCVFVDHSMFQTKQSSKTGMKASNPYYGIKHDASVKFKVGGQLGLSLTYKMSRRLHLYFSPTMYMFKKTDFPKDTSISGMYLKYQVTAGLEVWM